MPAVSSQLLPPTASNQYYAPAPATYAQVGLGNLGDDAVEWLSQQVGSGSGKWLFYGAGALFLLFAFGAFSGPREYRGRR